MGHGHQRGKGQVKEEDAEMDEEDAGGQHAHQRPYPPPAAPHTPRQGQKHRHDNHCRQLGHSPPGGIIAGEEEGQGHQKGGQQPHRPPPRHHPTGAVDGQGQQAAQELHQHEQQPRQRRVGHQA